MNSTNQKIRKKSLISAVLLLIASIVWGFAFVSQSIGAEFVQPLTFLALRSWIAVAMLLPISYFIKKRSSKEDLSLQKESRPESSDREKSSMESGAGAFSKEKTSKRNGDVKTQIMGGLICGTALFLASYAQQAGIAGTTTAKAGFITTLYVILVPILSIFLGQMPSPKIWLCVVIGVAGLYCLCGPSGGLNRGDLIVMLCALLFSVQILAVNHFIQKIDGVTLSLMQTLTEAIYAVIFMLILEHPDMASIRSAMPAILYAGIMSSGVGYTLQIIGQGGLDPTVASLIMCLESVFSAIGGWLILGQKLSGVELFGCALMFIAIIISQLPLEGLVKKKN